MTTVLIPPARSEPSGQAKYRVAGLPGPRRRALRRQPGTRARTRRSGSAFGTIYDVSTVAILALAGLSFAMTLASWIPPYLPGSAWSSTGR